MRADTLAHLGNPAAITPNLDQMVREDGVSFRSAFCQNPVCVPSRCSFFTGLYPHVNGHRTMSYLLRPGEDSLLKELKEAGYYVWMNDRNDLTAGQYEGWTQEHADEIFYGVSKKPAPGPVDPHIRGERGDKHYYSHFRGQLKTDERGLNYTSDDEAVDEACRLIREWKEERPLCIFLGLMYPHTPYQVEEPYFSAIDRGKLPRRVRPEECSGKPRMEELIRSHQNLESFDEKDWDELRAVYQGMCMKVDEQFGRLRDAMREAGIYDDSLIFFFSDHGDYTGDYGLAEKAQNCFEDCLTRVPFLIKPPRDQGISPGIRDGLVELVDFYATAMDYAGVTPSHTQFGRSLRPAVSDPACELRRYAFCEGGRLPGEEHCDEYHGERGQVAGTNSEYWPKQISQKDDFAHAKGIMIRDQRYKYISRTLGSDELYDLLEDPGETHNRIEDPGLAGELVRLQTAMLKWLQSTADIVPYDMDRRFTTEGMWMRVRAMVPPEYEDEVKDKIREGMRLAPLTEYCRSLADRTDRS
ncbi:MAG: sulfatase-like hydrolase/transferase [Hungatella sp.]|nr:sulfatase-like hydrolase/transferase [Hungatella sp.]